MARSHGEFIGVVPYESRAPSLGRTFFGVGWPLISRSAHRCPVRPAFVLWCPGAGRGS